MRNLYPRGYGFAAHPLFEERAQITTFPGGNGVSSEEYSMKYSRFLNQAGARGLCNKAKLKPALLFVMLTSLCACTQTTSEESDSAQAVFSGTPQSEVEKPWSGYFAERVTREIGGKSQQVWIPFGTGTHIRRGTVWTAAHVAVELQSKTGPVAFFHGYNILDLIARGTIDAGNFDVESAEKAHLYAPIPIAKSNNALNLAIHDFYATYPTTGATLDETRWLTHERAQFDVAVVHLDIDATIEDGYTKKISSYFSAIQWDNISVGDLVPKPNVNYTGYNLQNLPVAGSKDDVSMVGYGDAITETQSPISRLRLRGSFFPWQTIAWNTYGAKYNKVYTGQGHLAWILLPRPSVQASAGGASIANCKGDSGSAGFAQSGTKTVLYTLLSEGFNASIEIRNPGTPAPRENPLDDTYLGCQATTYCGAKPFWRYSLAPRLCAFKDFLVKNTPSPVAFDCVTEPVCWPVKNLFGSGDYCQGASAAQSETPTMLNEEVFLPLAASSAQCKVPMQPVEI